MRITRWVRLFCGLLLLSTGISVVRAEGPSTINESLAAYLPSGAWGTVELAKLEPVIERIRTSDALKMALESPQWREAQKQEQIKKALAGIALAQNQLGMSLWEFAKTYFGDRVILGVYPPSQPGEQPNGVIVVRVNQAKSLTDLWDRLSPLLPLAGDKIKVGEHAGGGRLLTFEDGHQAVIRDRWVVISKVPTLLDQTLQNFGNTATAAQVNAAGLLESSAWKQMGEQIGTDHHVQLCVNMIRLKELAGRRLVPSKLDNPLISLLFGGYLELAAESSYLGTTLDVSDNRFEVKSTVAGDPLQFDASHRPFVLTGNAAARADVPLLATPLGTFSLARDFSQWYRNREALLDAALLPNFDKFETGLAVFMAGRDFGEDVLPMLGQRLTIVTVPQTFRHLNGEPGVKLPGVAVLLDLAKPAEASDVLNLVFQTVVLISNLQASQEGRQTFVLSSKTLSSKAHGDTQIAFAKYVKQAEGSDLPISYNFQPASARVGDRYIFASSLETCEQLIDSLHTEIEASHPFQPSPPDEFRDLYLEISPTVAAELLKLNRAFLQAQTLQQGKTAEQSTQELDYLDQLLRQLTPLGFTSTRYKDRWVLELRGGWK